MRAKMILLVAAMIAVVTAGSPANAIHWYRGTGSGCSAADGALTGDPDGTIPNVSATIVVGHNTYSEGISGFDASSLVAPTETTINAGESVRWTWNSSHCHSVSSSTSTPNGPLFDSGLHYPTTPPESPQVVPGFFEYPILDDSPTLSYTRTFTTPGRYSYFCVHHVAIGMQGVIVVR